MRRNVNKIDFAVIITVLLLMIIIYSARDKQNGKKAVISVNGEAVKEVSLNKNQIFTLEENKNIVFEVRDGKIRFAESDCPDKICIHTGFIGSQGQSAVCLPNKTSISIPGDIDASA